MHQCSLGTSGRKQPNWQAPAVKINAEDRPGAAAVLAYSAALVWPAVHQASPVQPDVRTEAFQWLAAQPKLWKETRRLLQGSNRASLPKAQGPQGAHFDLHDASARKFSLEVHAAPSA